VKKVEQEHGGVVNRFETGDPPGPGAPKKLVSSLIAQLKEEYGSEVMRVVFKDSSFENTVVKSNAIEVLKQFGIDEVVSV